MSADACTRCSHPRSAHGYGCTHGWLGGNGNVCHCPDNSDGQPSTPCCTVHCQAQPVTHVDTFGQFFCAEHAAEEGRRYRLRAIDDVKSWVVSSS